MTHARWAENGVTMHKTDTERLLKLLRATSETLGSKALSPDAQTLWVAMMSRYEIEAVQRAFVAHLRDAERGRFFPTPADIVAQIEGDASTRETIAWGRVFDAISAHGMYASVDFGDPAIHAALEAMGGWVAVCQSGEAETWLRKRFAEEYRAAVKGGRSGPRQLSGICDTSNAANGHVRHIQPPVRLTDRPRPLLTAAQNMACLPAPEPDVSDDEVQKSREDLRRLLGAVSANK